MAELVDDGVTGWVVPVRSPGALAAGIQKALVADTAVGAAGRNRAESMFAAAAMVSEFASLYDEVAS